MSFKDLSARTGELLASYLRHHPDADATDLGVFAALHPDDAPELAALFLEIEELRALVDLPAHVIAAHLRYGDLHDGLPAPQPRGENRTELGSELGRILLKNLPRGIDTDRRYRIEEEFARGGMGSILRVWDRDLHRHLAMKVSLLKSEALAGGATPPGDVSSLARFLDEAEVTAQLDHPGIVPVHELGVDANGRVYFTMKLVNGRTLKAVLDLVAKGEEGWTQARALSVLSKVCEAMSYAHHKGVVHRDLKPGNVMVGRYGEVYVMDWGLAKVLGREDSKRVAIAPEAATIKLHSKRRQVADESPDSPLLTMDGDVVGTPAFMPPEQALGLTDEIGPHSDVYAVGAMLYQLLAGHMPHVYPGAKLSNYAVLYKVQEGPPDPLLERAPRAPAELVAICEKAMHRQPAQRYRDMEAFGRDLRAFLDRDFVSAYTMSPLERAYRWARLHRAFVLSAALVFFIAVIAMTLVQHERVKSRQRLLQLSRSQLVAAFNTLWPPHPANLNALEDWVAQAQEVLGSRDQDLVALARLKELSLPMDPDAPLERAERTRLATQVRRRGSLIRYYADMLAAIDSGGADSPKGKTREWVAEQVDWNSMRLAGEEAEEAAGPEQLTFRFADIDDQILYEALSLLISEQEKLLGSEDALGLFDLAQWGLGATRELEERSLIRVGSDWERAVRSIGDPSECPLYAGLDLRPQMGLAPLGRDRRSGLWEFAHVASGLVPGRDARGELEIDENSAIVLVLVPGGALLRGSQGTDPAGSNYDPWTEASSTPIELIELQPFFLSKYELTQAQWFRVTSRNPSMYRIGGVFRWQGSPLHPLEYVSSEDAQRVMHVMGLGLPTEAQWEWSQRAGTNTPWSSGSLPEELGGYANVADASGVLDGVVPDDLDGLTPGLDDGFPFHAPIGSLLPNAYGLHDMMGNVREWCRDTGPFEYANGLTRIETGERVNEYMVYWDNGTRAVRGGSFALPARSCRSAARQQVGHRQRYLDLGIRPGREIDR